MLNLKSLMANPQMAPQEEGDFDLIALWLQRDPVRWVAGAVTGAFAGMVSILVGGILSAKAGLGFLFPIKLLATVILGSSATEYDAGAGVLIVGFVFYEFLAAFAGVFYAHFTRTENRGFLLSMGATWGVFTWVFWWNLYFQSWSTISDTQVGAGGPLFVCLAYGLSLASVNAFDRILRR